MAPEMNPVALACVLVLGLLLFGFGPVVSVKRGQTRTFIGFSAEPTDGLHKLIRAHANTAEYAPFLAVLMLYHGAHHPADWVVWTMVAATACRCLFVVGMVAPKSMATPNPARFFGALGTYVTGALLSIALVL
jgi:uncharacterized membrane protein YecN with MAPEG domain